MTPETLSREDPVAIAESLGPQLSASALAVERSRQLDQQVVDALNHHQLFDLLRPAAFGGLEATIKTQLQVSAQLGEACVSTAWCHTVWGVHAWLLAHFPTEAQEEVWVSTEGAAPLISASLLPRGRVEQPAQSIIVNGQWEFASGCDYAEWFLLGALVPGADREPPTPYLFLVPRDACAIADNWHVSGLSGTGSKDVIVARQTIPPHRQLALNDVRERRSPGLNPNRHSLYRNPLFGVLAVVLAGAPLGGARGALNEYAMRLRRRTMTSGRAQSELASAHLRLAESAADIDAATLMLERVCDDLAAAGAGPAPPLMERARYTRDTAYAVRLCARAVNRLYEASGGHALQTTSPIQRFWRDVNAASTHATINWDTQGENYGRIAIGLEPSMPRV
ncbi:MAG: acyl-CoA dehydrogenase family protein [Pseudomonadota bacterium]